MVQSVPTLHSFPWLGISLLYGYTTFSLFAHRSVFSGWFPSSLLSFHYVLLLFLMSTFLGCTAKGGTFWRTVCCFPGWLVYWPSAGLVSSSGHLRRYERLQKVCLVYWYLVLCSDALLCFSNTALEVHWDPVLPLLHFMSLKKLSKAHSINICQDSPVAPSHPRLPLWGFW